MEKSNRKVLELRNEDRRNNGCSIILFDQGFNLLKN